MQTPLQLTAVALAALTWSAVTIVAERAGRTSPGRGGPALTSAVRPAATDLGLSSVHMVQGYGSRPLGFEANRGQTDLRVKFLARGPRSTLFLTSEEAVLVLNEEAPGRGRRPPTGPADSSRVRAVLRMTFGGANPNPRIEGRDELPGRANYFVGRTPTRWRTGVATYAEVRYADLYPGIDLIYHARQRELEYDLVVRPGGDPTRIALDVRGADTVAVDQRGDLVLQTAAGMVRQPKPVIYQRIDGGRRVIPGGYVLGAGGRIGVRVGPYDPSRPLVIDPVLVYSTRLGGNNLDEGTSIAVDRAGNAYVTGFTYSANFPTLPEAAQPRFGGAVDVFVAKLNPTGSALVYTTYLGGTGDDRGLGVAVDSAGNAYVAGITLSPDFPTTAGAVGTTFGGESDAFVAKLSPNGSALVYSTYLGGINFDAASAIAVDTAGHAWVAGLTWSADFPTTERATQRALRGPENAFVTKLNRAGSTLVYSTYLGGSAFDAAAGIAVDAAGNAYVTGATSSIDFPTTARAVAPTRLGAANAFVTKLDPAGGELAYSTYLGGGDDEGLAIAVDAHGNAYVTGTTSSRRFPTTHRAFQGANGDVCTAPPPQFCPAGDGFVTKLNPTGSAFAYSTYLGGNGADVGFGIAVDSHGNAYVTGSTSSTNFPSTPGALRRTLAGRLDAFVTQFNPAGAVVHSTYLGGGGDDAGFGIAVHTVGEAYLTGSTASTDFPTTHDVVEPPLGGLPDGFVARIRLR
jgi:beta-propeller repeat-containing protein